MDHHEYPTISAEPPEPVDYDWEARRQLFEELRAPDQIWLASLPKVAARSLLITSTQDDRDVDETAKHLPDVHIVKVKTDHWIHQNEPTRFLATVRSFLER